MNDNPAVVLLIEPDPASMNYLASNLKKAGYGVLSASSGREGLIVSWKEKPQALLVNPVLPDIEAGELISKLRNDSRSAGIPCILLLEATAQGQAAALLNAGYSDYLVKSGQLLQQVLALLPAMIAAGKTAGPGGALIVVLSAKGGTGTSSLAANLAMCAGQAHLDKKVAVMDLVLPIGSIASIVGYDQALNLVSAAALDRHAITADFFRANLPKIRDWHFSLLAGSPDPDSANRFPAERTPIIIHALLECHDYLFVDLGRSLSRISLPIIQKADLVVLVLGTDLSSVTLSQITWEYLREQGVQAARVFPILNRAVGLEGLTRAETENQLGLEIKVTIPYVGGSFALANNRHEPLVQKFPEDSASLMLKQTAAEILQACSAMHGA